jgi:hypothetical protein
MITFFWLAYSVYSLKPDLAKSSSYGQQIWRKKRKKEKTGVCFSIV